jgi:threonine dehydratase
MELPTIETIRQAAARLEGKAHRTPVATSITFNERYGCQAFFKCENHQRVGAFKFRGAYNSLSQLTREQRKRGVLTFSSGNHGQALACAGAMLETPVVVIMPADAPPMKLAATRGYGAEVIEYDRDEISREALGQQLSKERGLTIIPPYDHIDIISGQGTAGLELIEDVPDLDIILVPVGGGGLLAGTALAAAALSPSTKVIGVEPAAADDACRSFKTGVLQSVDNPVSVADGARTPSIGHLNFAVIKEHVHDMIPVSEEAILEMTRFYWERMKQVVEPTGAVSAAAISQGLIDVSGKRVGIIISGGNFDLGTATELFAHE